MMGIIRSGSRSKKAVWPRSKSQHLNAFVLVPMYSPVPQFSLFIHIQNWTIIELDCTLKHSVGLGLLTTWNYQSDSYFTGCRWAVYSGRNGRNAISRVEPWHRPDRLQRLCAAHDIGRKQLGLIQTLNVLKIVKPTFVTEICPQMYYRRQLFVECWSVVVNVNFSPAFIMLSRYHWY